MPLGDHAAHWSNLLGEIVREFPMHYPSWHKILAKRKAGAIGNIRIAFWLDPKNAARAAQNARNRAKSAFICWQGSRSLAVLRDMQMESSETREYPSQIQTYFDTHTVDGVFLRDEERLLYEEMLRLKDLGSNMPTGMPYTDDKIMAMVRRGKQQGHIPGVGRVLAGQGRDVLTIPEPRCAHTADVDELQSQHEVGSGNGSGGGGNDEPGEDEDADEDEDTDGDEDSYDILYIGFFRENSGKNLEISCNSRCKKTCRLFLGDMSPVIV
ncbi:hypothetical protein Tco_0894018 [Tanacetum coccineum]|uniref:Uncharacterized protein n=1 Tax=Tanacetum coccineum TaxID=301880 RepID=A0ABQ5CAH8_9ASTR